MCRRLEEVQQSNVEPVFLIDIEESQREKESGLNSPFFSVNASIFGTDYNNLSGNDDNTQAGVILPTTADPLEFGFLFENQNIVNKIESRLQEQSVQIPSLKIDEEGETDYASNLQKTSPFNNIQSNRLGPQGTSLSSSSKLGSGVQKLAEELEGNSAAESVKSGLAEILIKKHNYSALSELIQQPEFNKGVNLTLNGLKKTHPNKFGPTADSIDLNNPLVINELARNIKGIKYCNTKSGKTQTKLNPVDMTFGGHQNPGDVHVNGNSLYYQEKGEVKKIGRTAVNEINKLSPYI